MESREIVINNLMQEITKQITQKFTTLDKIENYLKNYSKFFTILEIKEYGEKVSILKYLTFTNKDIDVNIYYILDINNFLITLKEKKKNLIRDIYIECINSISNYDLFYNFVKKSEFYFNNNHHYFKREEIERYNEIWFELEIENALILSDNDELKIKQKWNENYENILKQIKEMLIFLNTLDI